MDNGSPPGAIVAVLPGAIPEKPFVSSRCKSTVGQLVNTGSAEGRLKAQRSGREEKRRLHKQEPLGQFHPVNIPS
jgi:hypothetical protein